MMIIFEDGDHLNKEPEYSGIRQSKNGVPNEYTTEHPSVPYLNANVKKILFSLAVEY
jgi:hypothetical protein